jgi:hypothetical protein
MRSCSGSPQMLTHHLFDSITTLCNGHVGQSRWGQQTQFWKRTDHHRTFYFNLNFIPSSIWDHNLIKFTSLPSSLYCYVMVIWRNHIIGHMLATLSHEYIMIWKILIKQRNFILNFKYFQSHITIIFIGR